MLVDRFKQALGKSTGRQTLYDHSLSCVDVALRVAHLAGEAAGPRLDRLIFATFVHDVGKLDPDFQNMLEAAAGGEGLPDKKVKHEASTFDYDHPQLLEESKDAIREELRSTHGYGLDLRNLEAKAMDHVWAFAVTHHGFFHLSYEWDRKGVLRPLIRRQWTSFYPNEERRITLVDLLFEYHPLGGVVMIADLVASYCHEQGKDYQALFSQVGSCSELLERLVERAEEIEAGVSHYDPRDYGLRETLTLLAGGIR